MWGEEKGQGVGFFHSVYSRLLGTRQRPVPSTDTSLPTGTQCLTLKELLWAVWEGYSSGPGCRFQGLHFS